MLMRALLFVALLVPALAGAQEPAPLDAKSTLVQGDVLFRRGRHREAFELYKRAHQQAPSASTAYALARCYQQFGDEASAIAFYGRFVGMAPEAPNRAEVEDRIAELQERLDTRASKQAALVQAAEERAVRRAAERPPLEPEKSRRLKWAGLGVLASGGLMVGISVGLAVSASQRIDDLNGLPKGTPYTQARADQVNAVRAREYASYALGGLGAAAMASGLVVLAYRGVRINPGLGGMSFSWTLP
jgi:tetratricopeptide (TPR) repeat protein